MKHANKTLYNLEVIDMANTRTGWWNPQNIYEEEAVKTVKNTRTGWWNPQNIYEEEVSSISSNN